MKIGHTDPPEDDDARETDRWTVADLIDLEYFLGADEQLLHEGTAARNALTERDRTLYLDRIAPAVATTLPHTTLHRRLSLRHWLRERRAAERPERRLVLPGRTFAQAQRLTALGLAVLGFLIGVGAASALLSYDGHRPINVALYLFVLVFVQFLLVGGASVAWLVRRARPVGQAVRDLSLLGRLIRPLVTRVSHWLLRQHLPATRQEVNDRTATQVGRLRSQFALYGPVSFLPMLIPAQVFGVAFNLGVILTTIGLEWFTDLAFGWQTALDLSPQFIHDLARFVATPWGWLFGEGIGYPSLEQVAGSRILLKDPLSLLDAGHLRSWRWFLVLAVCTYGLLPRLLLLGASLLTQRHLLERLPFTQGRTQALYARLLTPTVETATHGSGHGTAMPIPAPVTHQGPLARPIAAPPTRPPTPPMPPRPTDQVAVPGPKVAAPQSTPAPVTDRPRPLPAPPPTPEPAAIREPERKPQTQPDREPAPQPIAGLAPQSAAALEPQPSPEEPAHRPERAAPPTPEPEPEPAVEPAPTPTAAPLEPRGTEVSGGIAADACLVLVQLDVDEVIESAQRHRVAELVGTLTGWRVAASASFGSGSAMTAGVVNWVEGQRWQAPPARVAVIMDGSQPPITENLRFLRELRAAAGTQAQVLLALVGDPQDDDPLPPVRAFDFTDWQRKIAQLGDPYLRLDMLAPGGDDGDA
ncbi:DUF2868 domain-containing protein [uncultured Thiodictyon sp.]|jgi:hypothetical protein|uniref:DUF2868 domain-containing protein n=1 Tax=uncultured Thiodictyon sp. TaxID=1846217 RepID=UPI0025E70BB7|nr:DUF2868 domain-containing protein [uncultured Thiodictyon sp.]